MTVSRDCGCDSPPCDSSEGCRGSDISSVFGVSACLPSLPSSDDCLLALLPSSLRLIPLSPALSTSHISSALSWTQTYKLIPLDKIQKLDFFDQRDSTSPSLSSSCPSSQMLWCLSLSLLSQLLLSVSTIMKFCEDKGSEGTDWDVPSCSTLSLSSFRLE